MKEEFFYQYAAEKFSKKPAKFRLQRTQEMEVKSIRDKYLFEKDYKKSDSGETENKAGR